MILMLQHKRNADQFQHDVVHKYVLMPDKDIEQIVCMEK